ncbi:hypothetical protein AB4114_35110 [Paenibacillus sp. 2RAB27]|uniref:hypothetical protein n=1 Tax=Paenibacillus sp. 2RAB27 TaxID=3232991 RepID=UPI003F9DD88C
MTAIAYYLYAIVSSGYYGKQDWQDWADKRILRETHVEDWLISLSLARDIATVQSILSILMVSERYIVSNPPNLNDTTLGFCYLRYLDSKLSSERVVV